MKNLTVIFPLYDYKDENFEMVERALRSFLVADGASKDKTNFLVVGNKADISLLKEKSQCLPRLIEFVENEKNDFCNQINVAVKHCKTDYFSILETDDEYTPYYFKNLETYMRLNPNYFGFLPLNEVYDTKALESGAIGYINEAFWASAFSEKIGVLDEDSVTDYLSINVTGGVFKTKEFIEIGGLKSSIKVAFWHEFLLRALHKNMVIYVIPKVGYKHYTNRDGSLTDVYNKTMTQEEAEWWVNLSKEEFYYKTDRNKKYEE